MMGIGQAVFVAALRDGSFDIPHDVLDASGVPAGTPSATPIFAFVIHFGTEAWLVDAGAGPCLGADAGCLPEALDATGIDPGMVTRILLTHLHPDHVGGLADVEGRPTFPGAEVAVSRREWADWLDPGPRETHDADATQVAQWAERALSGYRVVRIEPAQHLGSGVLALPAGGHRAGHLAFLLDAPDGGTLFAGDILHLPTWQIADPDRGLIWDVDIEAAAATRRRLLGRAADEGRQLACAHAGLVRVERAESGFRRVLV